MATLTAVETSSQTMLIFSSSNSLPSQESFLDGLHGDQLYMYAYGSQTCGTFGNNTSLNYPDIGIQYYGICEAGYLAYTGNGTISDPDISSIGSGAFFGHKVYFGEINNAGTDCYIQHSNVSLNLNDGFVTSGITVLNSAISTPYINSAIDANLGINIYRANGVGYDLTIKDLDSDLVSYYTFVSDGIGTITQQGIYEIDTSIEDGPIPYVNTYKNRYRSFSSVDDGTWRIVDFDLVAFGNPFDFTIYEIAFDTGTYLEYFNDVFTDGENYYLVVVTDSDGNRINPILLKVNFEWTEYEKIFIQAGDSEAQARISNYLAGNGDISFAYDETSGNILMTAGVEPPMFYGVSAPQGPQSDRSTKRPTPYKLPCIVNCIPFFRG